jgi:N-methylhydantoinase B
MTNTMNTPIESLEMTYPLRVWRYSLREKSGGKGKYTGGQGIIREYEFLSEATITLNMERRINAPYGLSKGKPGKTGVNTLIQGGQTKKVGGKFTTRVQPGDRLIIETPGGGGWGA